MQQRASLLARTLSWCVAVTLPLRIFGIYDIQRFLHKKHDTVLNRSQSVQMNGHQLMEGFIDTANHTTSPRILQTSAALIEAHNDPSRETTDLADEDKQDSAPATSQSTKSTTSTDTTILRPGEGQAPDVVEFDIAVKRLVDINFKRENFVADVILFFRWQDQRVVRLVPMGHRNMVFSHRDIRGKIWIPDLDISNNDFSGTRLISSQYSVSASGTVERVDRVLTRFLGDFDPRFFPFDTQVLQVIVASKVYMVDALTLRPVERQSVVDKTLFSDLGFRFVSSKMEAVQDGDEFGMLKKSRGVLAMDVQRKSSPYWSVILVPEMMLVAFSYTVFLLPLTSTFVMPRVATTMVTFLTLMALTLKTSNLLPVRSGHTWIDAFEESCTSLVWSSCWLNIVLMVTIYDFKNEELALRLQREIQALFPALAAVLSAIAYFAFANLTLFTWLMRIVLVAFVGGHLGTSIHRVRSAAKNTS